MVSLLAACGIDSRGVGILQGDGDAAAGASGAGSVDPDDGESVSAGAGGVAQNESPDAGSGAEETGAQTPELLACPERVVSPDELLGLIRDDILLQNPGVRPFTRYLTLANRICGDDLDTERAALSLAVNMFSTRPSVVAPVPIDADRTVYRIDLDDYNWDRPIDVAGTTFNDAWEAIVARNPFAVPYVGPEADSVTLEAGTTVPVLFGDAFIATVVKGDLYYPLIGVDPSAALGVHVRDELEIDITQNLADEDVQRAGVQESAVAEAGVQIERHDIESYAGAFWQAAYLPSSAAATIFEDPAGTLGGTVKAIFTLPNGMFAYAVTDATGAVVESTDVILDPNQSDFRTSAPVSCSTCHFSGLIPVVDETRPFVEANLLAYDNETAEVTREIYPQPPAFAEQVRDDNADFQLAALTRAAVPATDGDPLSQAFQRFDLDLDLVAAARDLGVTQEALRAVLPSLPDIEFLASGSIDRDDWAQYYATALCRVHAAARNRPDPAVCM